MQILVDNSSLGNAVSVPTDKYLDVSDFSLILEHIANGKLPSGTGVPFPLFAPGETPGESEKPYAWCNNQGFHL